MDTNPNPASAPAPTNPRPWYVAAELDVWQQLAYVIEAHASDDNYKPQMAGAHFTASGDTLTIRVTDSYTLARITTQAVHVTGTDNATALIPAAPLVAAIRAAHKATKKNHDRTAVLMIDATRWELRAGDTTTGGEITTAEFPNVATFEADYMDGTPGTAPTFEGLALAAHRLADVIHAPSKISKADNSLPIQLTSYNGPTRPVGFTYKTDAMTVAGVVMPVRITR
jgi:hypothetical protein